MLLTAVDMWRLHPYEYTYFNRSFSGGLKTAAKYHETDYLGLSYQEGFAWLLANYWPKHERSILVASCPGFHANLVDAHERSGDEGARFQPVLTKELSNNNKNHNPS